MSELDFSPAELNLKVVQGDDLKPMSILVQYGDPPVTADISTYVIEAHIRTTAASIPFLIDMTDAPSGIFWISLTKEQTALLRGTYTWELDWTDDEGDHVSTLRGEIEVIYNV